MKDLIESTGTTDGACHCRSNVELPWLRMCSSNEESRSSSGTPSVEQAFPLNWSDRQALPSCPPLTTAHVKEKGVHSFPDQKMQTFLNSTGCGLHVGLRRTQQELLPWLPTLWMIYRVPGHLRWMEFKSSSQWGSLALHTWCGHQQQPIPPRKRWIASSLPNL